MARAALLLLLLLLCCAPLSYCYHVITAAAAAVHQAAADEEPLALSGVTVSPAAAQAIQDAWRQGRQHSVYTSGQQLVELVTQVC